MTGFWTPQCVEAAFLAHVSYSSRIGIERALDAALAAKDRETLIEQAASALAIADEYDPNAVSPERWAQLRDDYRHEARVVLAALGLLASPDEKGQP